MQIVQCIVASGSMRLLDVNAAHGEYDRGKEWSIAQSCLGESVIDSAMPATCLLGFFWLRASKLDDH